jgi:hypothetical protein
MSRNFPTRPQDTKERRKEIKALIRHPVVVQDVSA